jgi:hypothetical protein
MVSNGVTWLITLEVVGEGWGGGQNRPWVLRTLKSSRVKEEENWFQPVLNVQTHFSLFSSQFAPLKLRLWLSVTENLKFSLSTT